MHKDLLLRLYLQDISLASPSIARQSPSAVTQNKVHVGESNAVAIRVCHGGVDWFVVWATRPAFFKQNTATSDGVRIATCYVRKIMLFVKAKSEYNLVTSLIMTSIHTQSTAFCGCALIGVHTSVVPRRAISVLEICA